MRPWQSTRQQVGYFAVAFLYYHNTENYDSFCSIFQYYLLADLTASKRPGTSFGIEIRFTVFNRLYLLFSFMKLVET